MSPNDNLFVGVAQRSSAQAGPARVRGAGGAIVRAGWLPESRL
jgi:hypothetical protein